MDFANAVQRRPQLSTTIKMFIISTPAFQSTASTAMSIKIRTRWRSSGRRTSPANRNTSPTGNYHDLGRGGGGGLVVSVLTFYSDNPSSIPADNFNLFEKMKINEKEAGVGPLKKTKAF